ncbi:hypothetical protein SALBM311S_11728 [Streptomyces alboniger]
MACGAGLVFALSGPPVNASYASSTSSVGPSMRSSPRSSHSTRSQVSRIDLLLWLTRNTVPACLRSSRIRASERFWKERSPVASASSMSRTSWSVMGKTAVYRRWRSKLHLVLDLVSALAVQGLPVPDTGSLEGDLRLLYEVTSRALRHPVASQVIPDLQAEAARNPEIAEALQKALREGQEGVASKIVVAAEGRGEIRNGFDADLALDLISGPLYWRSVVIRSPKLPKGYLASLARATAEALKAL